MPWQCDQMGHMNARYIYACFDDATAVFAAQLGADFGQVATMGRQEIEFLHELKNGSAVTVTTSLVAIGRSSIQFRHDLSSHDAADVAARMNCKSVRFDTNTRRSVPLDNELRERVTGLLPTEAKHG
jgi:acyl-CoA thioester hydrolase